MGKYGRSPQVGKLGVDWSNVSAESQGVAKEYINAVHSEDGRVLYQAERRAKDAISKNASHQNQVNLDYISTKFQDFNHRHDNDDFIGNAVKTAGRAVASGVDAVKSATGEVTDAIQKVPVIGPVWHATLELQASSILLPFRVGDAIVHGKRIDKAVLDHFESEVNNIKEVAPYVQTVISFVPGVGQGISGALGAGLAIASGKSIDQAVIDGVASSLPGGPLAKLAFQAAGAAVQGKDVGQIGLSALPVSPQVRQLISTGLSVTQKLTSGAPIDKTIVDAALAQIPSGAGQQAARSAVSAAYAVGGGKDVGEVLANEIQKNLPVNADVKKALQIGTALAYGKKLQDVAAQQLPNVLPAAMAQGLQRVMQDPVLQAARKAVPADAVKGFDAAVALMQNGGSRMLLNKARDMLSPQLRKGFDMGMALHIGRVAHKAPVNVSGAAQVAGHAMTRGMQGAPAKNKVIMMKGIASHPDAATGAKAAILQVADARKTWWDRVLEFFGIK